MRQSAKEAMMQTTGAAVPMGTDRREAAHLQMEVAQELGELHGASRSNPVKANPMNMPR